MENSTTATEEQNGSALGAGAGSESENNAERYYTIRPKSTEPFELPPRRTNTQLAYSLVTHTESGKRKSFEPHGVHFQCETVLGKFDPSIHICWLCGFPIDKLISNGFTMHKPMLDKATCEHVLPVKLGHGVLEILYLMRDPLYEKLLHTEYEYAHNHCNYIKADEYFMTLPLGSTDFCNLAIHEKRIDDILGRIYYIVRGGGHSDAKQSSIVNTVYNGKKYSFANPVQAYCFSADPEKFLRNHHAVGKQWAAHAKKLIIEKMKRLIGYIQEVDHCVVKNNAEKGKHYSGFVNRLQTGLPALPKGQRVLPGKVAARRPSITNISALYASNALVPFAKNNTDVASVGSNISLGSIAYEFAMEEGIKEAMKEVETEGEGEAIAEALGAGAGPGTGVVEEAEAGTGVVEVVTAPRNISSGYKQTKLNRYFRTAKKNRKNNKNTKKNKNTN